MREIKFRAWDKIEGKMWTPIIDVDGIPCAKHPISQQLLRMTGELLDPVMQFTGLHDKNGTEIYEGDILEIDGEIVAPVTFEDGSFQLISDVSHGRSPLIQDRAKRFCIAGNIYQNPEFLNET